MNEFTASMPDARGVGRAYRVARAASPLYRRCWDVTRPATGAWYRVGVGLDGGWRCSCADFFYRNRPCKHVELVVAREKEGLT